MWQRGKTQVQCAILCATSNLFDPKKNM